MTLRLLDETGRHRIAERMLGILTELSDRGFEIRLVGPAGRPLSRGLAPRQKVQITFLDTALHERVESMACTLRSVRAGRQPDAWTVVLELPQLPPDLTHELMDALKRYEPESELHLPWRALALVATCGLLAILLVCPGSAEPPRPSSDAQRERLERHLAYSTETIDRLVAQLEEADRAVHARDEQIRDYRAELERLQARIEAPPVLAAATVDPGDAIPGRSGDRLGPGGESETRLHLRGATWEDFRAVLDIRGSHASPRLAYVDGAIELSQPSVTHRRVTRMLTRLLGAYALTVDLDLRALGPRILASKTSRTGIEPEEVFVLGSDSPASPARSEASHGRADIVFDIAGSTEVGALLERYRGPGVPEVWLRVGDELAVHRLEDDGGYTRSEWSDVLPDLDVKLVGSLLERTDQTRATRDFIRSLPAP